MTRYISFFRWIEFTYISSLYIYQPQKIHRIGTPKGKIESDSNCCTDFSYSMWFYILRMMRKHKFRDFIPCEPAYHSSFQPAPLYMVSKLLTVPTILSQLLGFRVLVDLKWRFGSNFATEISGMEPQKWCFGNRGRSLLKSLKTHSIFWHLSCSNPFGGSN